MSPETMTAGRTLDALVAQKVMGCVVRHPLDTAEHSYKCGCPGNVHGNGENTSGDLKDYSTDIDAAMDLVGKVGPIFTIELRSDRKWQAGVGTRWNLAVADTAPLAICRGALLAVAG